MNKYAIQDYLREKLSEYSSTLKNTSLDTAKNAYLCSDVRTSNVYDFDKYVRENNPNPLPASPDAILLGNKKLYFIEFKNSEPSQIDKQQLKRKFEHGTRMLKQLLDGFVPRDVEHIFCVVYKRTPTAYFNPAHIESNVVKFGLKEKNEELDTFYDQVIIEDVDFYKRNFSELSC